MKEIRTEIEIKANKEKVWDILTDFSSYPQWNPFLVKVSAELRPKAPVELHVPIAGTTPALDAAIVEATPNKRLIWAGPISRFKGIFFRGEHYFIIEEVSQNHILFIHGERFEGLLLPVLDKWLDRNIAPKYSAMNEALKNRAESLTMRK